MKCEKCNKEVFYILENIDTEEDKTDYSEIWRCIECSTYYKISYKRTNIERLYLKDEKVI